MLGPALPAAGAGVLPLPDSAGGRPPKTKTKCHMRLRSLTKTDFKPNRNTFALREMGQPAACCCSAHRLQQHVLEVVLCHAQLCLQFQILSRSLLLFSKLPPLDIICVTSFSLLAIEPILGLHH